MLNICLSNQIHRANQLHPWEVCTVQLRHHRFDLSAVNHTHQNGFNDIIKMVSQCNLITSQYFRLMVQMPTPHSCTEIAGIVFYIINGIKDIGFKYGNRDLQQFCIGFNNGSVFRTIPRIHDQKDQFKREFSMPLQFLKQLCHQHRIFSAGNTNCNPVIRLNQIIRIDCFCKPTENDTMKFFSQALFNFCCLFTSGFPANFPLQPLHISANQIHRRKSVFPQFCRCVFANNTTSAINHQ